MVKSRRLSVLFVSVVLFSLAATSRAMAQTGYKWVEVPSTLVPRRTWQNFQVGSIFVNLYSELRLTWNEVRNADRYRLWRVNPDGTLRPVGYWGLDYEFAPFSKWGEPLYPGWRDGGYLLLIPIANFNLSQPWLTMPHDERWGRLPYVYQEGLGGNFVALIYQNGTGNRLFPPDQEEIRRHMEEVDRVYASWQGTWRVEARVPIEHHSVEFLSVDDSVPNNPIITYRVRGGMDEVQWDIDGGPLNSLGALAEGTYTFQLRNIKDLTHSLHILHL